MEILHPDEAIPVPDAPPPTLTLEIRTPGRAPIVHTIDKARTIIGRESGDLVLEDAEASALHAELDCSSGHVIVRDLGSSNGTWRGGKRLPQFALFEGQSFVCGTTELFLVSVQSASPQPQAGRTALGQRSEILESQPTLPRTTILGVPAGPAAAPPSSMSTAPEVPALGSVPPSVTHTLPGAPQATPDPPLFVTTEVPRLGEPAPAFASPGPDFESSATVRVASKHALPEDDADAEVTNPSLRRMAFEADVDDDENPALFATVKTPDRLRPGQFDDAMLERAKTRPMERREAPPPSAGPPTPTPTIPSSAITVVPPRADATSPGAATPGLGRRSATVPAPSSSSADVFRAPVSNAVIKDPGAVGGRTDPHKVVPPARRAGVGRFFAYAGLGVIAMGIVAAVGYFVFTLLSARGINVVRQTAKELPDDAVGFAVISSPRDLVDLFGDEVGDELRSRAKERYGFDPWSLEAWQSLGVDPDAPASFAVLDASDATVAVSFGVSDREALHEALANTLPTALGWEPVSWSDRSFGTYEGRFTEGPRPIALAHRDARATVIWSLRPPVEDGDDASVVERAMTSVLELREHGSLADREGFGELVAPEGRVLGAVYVDGASLRASIEGSGVVEMSMRLALANIDGAAAFLSTDGPRIHATYETIVDEGSRPHEFVRDVERTTVALDEIPAPVLAAFDGQVAPEALDRALGGVASLGAGSLAFFESAVRDELGIDVREDLVDNFGGRYGAALLRLPSERTKADFGLIGWVSVTDEAKAREVAERVYGKAQEQLKLRSEQVGEVTVYRSTPTDADPEVAAYVHHGHLFVTVGDVDESALIGEASAGFLSSVSHRGTVDDLGPGGIVAAFVDVGATLTAARASMSTSDLEALDGLESVTNLVEAFTVRGEVRDRTIVVRQTLHTTADEGLAALTQAVTAKIASDVAETLARAARSEKCAQISERMMELTRQKLAEQHMATDKVWEAGRRILEDCQKPTVPLERLDCYLAAQDLAGFAACEGDDPSPPSDPKLPAADEPDPTPVAYVEDIWPHVQDDADSRVPLPDVNYAVDVGSEPQFRGSERALITIVEFGDFECEYCRRSTAALDEVLSRHGDEVRLVFRHNPLDRHPNARSAAKAAIAAGRQGKFWAMHDKLFANQGTLSEDNFRTWATDLGLDLTTFERDYADPEVDRRIQRDIEAAAKFGATGTPVFFVNGRYLPGAQPAGAFESLIEQESERAKRFVERRGNTRKNLYDDMIGRFAPEVLQPSTDTELPDPDEKRFIVGTSGLPRKGAETFARVQIVECGDFDCPFCTRVSKTIDEVLVAYPTQVAFYFAHNPLSFHARAEPAARAAIAADKQGKFWEMHDLLFEDPDARTDGDFVGMARRLSLDVDRFKEDFAAEPTAALVAEQQKLCRDNEAQGTPTFFVNGRKIAGSKTLEQFKTIIDAELSSGI